MCFGGAPDPPDPYATAQAQMQVNQQALNQAAQLNQINQVNPYGQISYTGAIGSPDRKQTVTLNPQLQKLLTGQENLAQGLQDKSQGLLDQTNIQPFNPQAFNVQGAQNTQLATSFASPDSKVQTGYDAGGPITSSVNPNVGNLSTAAHAGPIQNQISNVGGNQRNLDFSGAPSLNTNFGQQAQDAGNAVYGAQTQYVDQNFDRQKSQLDSQLAAQGIPMGSAAYNDAHNQLQNQYQTTLQGARNAATTQGFNVQQGLFGENLAARQQGVGEATSQGQFQNQAQNQAFQQAAQRGDFGNAAQQQAFAQSYQNAQLNNSALGQQFGQNLQAGQFANQAQLQQNQENMGAAAFNNQANQQQFGQNAAQAQFGNQALAQQFGQNVAAQGAAQNLYQQQFGNQQAAQTQNINAIQAMNNSQQIAPSNPSFQPYATSTASQAAPNLIGLAGSNYQAQSQAASSGLGSIFGAVGNLGSAAIAACWVAREVYGEENPRWLQFRDWMLYRAPAKLRETYLRIGEQYAAHIKDKPDMKLALYGDMEAILG